LEVACDVLAVAVGCGGLPGQPDDASPLGDDGRRVRAILLKLGPLEIFRHGGSFPRPEGLSIFDRLAAVNPARTKEPPMDLGLKGQTALVTGGGKGRGEAVALGLAQEGVRVAICARDKASLEAAAQELARATGAEVLAVAGDLTRPDDVQRIVDSAAPRFCRLSVRLKIARSRPCE